jgi:alpha-amylase/alpha-mannosidase (GH57 family)
VSSVVVHGHFYQPPRENPWTGAIDREDSARPYHDWNERIAAECYRANAFARVVNNRNQIEYILNNYTNISFNFGPTLMGWLERATPHVYSRIVEADKHSVRRRGNHGNALAQAYNHAILPLCNERDRRTQVRWGVRDFRSRFGRNPEALWLPETACNDATMATLIDEGMKFVILSPHQAERVRPLGGEWRSVADGSIDPRMPYVYFHRDGSARSIAVFFYDAGLARGIAFENLLWSSQVMVERLEKAAAGGPLVNVATDGESYGHHYRLGERCLAYALEFEAPARGLKVTNYGEFLERHPPQFEVEIKAGPNGEGTAWSCAHGVGRWYRDCGCHTGGEPGWNQEWRGPLRAAFNLLRDECARFFEDAGGALLRDPWEARDDYVDVLLTHGAARERLLARHARRRLDDEDQLRALNLLEMQRDAMLMYTSCGWFFTELSGLETLQVMKYASRAMDLMKEVGGQPPINRFLEILSRARSNVAGMGNGADVFRRFVPGCRVTPRRMAAHLVISSLTESGSGNHGTIGDYDYRQEHFHRESHGRLSLVTGRFILTHRISGARREYASAALHLGGVDFYCALKPYPGMDEFRQSSEKVWQRFPAAALPAIIKAVESEFGPDEYGLQNVLTDGRLAICEMIFGDMLEGLTAQFAGLSQEYQREVDMLEDAGFEPPHEFRLMSEFTLGRRFQQEIQRFQRSGDPLASERALDIANIVVRRGYRIDRGVANQSFAAMITDAVRAALERPAPPALHTASDLLALAGKLHLEPNLDQAQEAVYDAFARTQADLARLSKLATALGLSPAALKRLKSARKKTPVQPKGEAAQAQGAKSPGAEGSARTQPGEPRSTQHR